MKLVALRGGSGSDGVLRGAQDVEDFEQEIVDQYALAMAAAGLTDSHVSHTRSTIIELGTKIHNRCIFPGQRIVSGALSL